MNEPQLKAALKSVLRYAEKHRDKWEAVVEAEVPVSLVKERDKIERYKKQLHVYAHLVEQNTRKKVSKLHLYYTGEEAGSPTISFDPTKMEIKETINDFDRIVQKIQDKNFETKSLSGKVCENCDFRFYCKRG